MAVDAPLRSRFFWRIALMLNRQGSNSHYIEMADGARLHLRSWPHRQDPSWDDAIVFLHGFGEGSFVWDDVIARSAGHTACIALDLRGHGDSDRAIDGKYDAALYTSDLVAVVKQLGIRRLVIVGHSMGADVAIRASAELESRLAGLVVVDYGPESNEAGRRRVREDFENSLRAYASAADYQRYLASTRFLSSPKSLAHFALHATRKGEDNFFYLKADSALTNGLKDRDPQALWTLLGNIACPTLLVRGTGSAVLSLATAHRMASSMQRCTLKQVDIAGHAVMLDNPEGFAAAVMPFLAQYSRAPIVQQLERRCPRSDEAVLVR
jgi:pimeloyl-ACP methyl ester carboxylesterase